MTSVETELRAEIEALRADVRECRAALAAVQAQQAAVGDVLRRIGSGAAALEDALFDIAQRALQLLSCDATVLLADDGRGGILAVGANTPDYVRQSRPAPSICADTDACTPARCFSQPCPTISSCGSAALRQARAHLGLRCLAHRALSGHGHLA